MHYVLLTDGIVDTIPEDPGGQVVWWLILAGFVAVYFLVARSRRRAAEHYREARRREAEMRANDPDMKQDDA